MNKYKIFDEAFLIDTNSLFYGSLVKIMLIYTMDDTGYYYDVFIVDKYLGYTVLAVPEDMLMK